MKYASFGSISSGTMLPADLIPTLASELDSLLRRQPKGFKRAEYRKLVREAEAIDDYDSEDAGYVLEDLFSKLEDFAPPYGYFGSHPGDGADYGFWLSEGWDENFDGAKVSDLSEIPTGYTGDVMLVNDHGNVTLYSCYRGRLREIWAIV
jgi:hypothetical protein